MSVDNISENLFTSMLKLNDKKLSIFNSINMAFSQFFTAKLFSGEINNDENNEDH